MIKINVRKLAALLVALVMAVGFCACGGGNYSKESYVDNGYYGGSSKSFMSSYDTAPAEENSYHETANESGRVSDSTESGTKPVYTGSRKIIRNATLELNTEKYSETMKAIETTTAEFGGYIESSNERKYSEYCYTSIVVRIPSDRFDEFLGLMDGVATVSSKYISSDDITGQYVDTESHLKALRTEQDTLLELLSKADGISEILQIQDRLTSVRSQIEYYQSMMNTFEDELAYSKVQMEVNEVAHEVETGDGFWARIGAGLKETFYDIGTDFAGFFEWLLINFPYIIIWLLVVFIIVLIIRKIFPKKFQERRAKRAEKKAAKKAAKAAAKEAKDAGQGNHSAIPEQK